MSVFDHITEPIRATAMRRAEDLLKSKPYDQSQVKDWIEEIATLVAEDCWGIAPAFKYVVQVSIVQKNGSGLSTHATAVWDNAGDGSVTATYDSASLSCLIHVFGFAL